MIRHAPLLLLLIAAAPPPLETDVRAVFAEAGPGTRFGIVVTDEAGKEILAIAPDERFIPASNTKIYTTVAAFATLPTLDQPDLAGATSVRLEKNGAAPDVVLTGAGDARLSSAANCTLDCLSTLADAVAAKTRAVRDVVGDDSLFPDERWSQGMSWNNIQSRSGTAASALTLDDNELPLTITPGAKAGDPPVITGLSYYTVDNRAWTIASGKMSLSFDRKPNDLRVVVTGSIAVGAEPATLRMSVDDPAHYAASRMKSLLTARGVRVTGAVRTRHRPLSPNDDPANRGAAAAPRPAAPVALATVVPPPLIEDLRVTNKVSQNLHAELFLRRVARHEGSGSVTDGIARIGTMLKDAQVPRTAWDFADGSGMSTYNRVSPRGTTTLLNWTAKQPWFEAFRATLPIGGVDGTTASRFKGTPLEGKLFAKTGSLNATNALAGFLTSASGRRLTFAVYANDVPDWVRATATMDKALNVIAAKN